MSKIDFFKPEDFIGADLTINPEETSARQANAKLSAALEAAPRVYAGISRTTWTDETWNSDKFTARLFNIEEIKKECEKHEPKYIESYTRNSDERLFDTVCKHCGVELIAEWRAK